MNFPGYYPPTNEEFKNLWDKCVFTLDANVLLNLYRYTPDTRSEFLRILERISERLWIPHQVAFEYQRNRLNVISQQKKAYAEVIDILDEARKSIEGRISEYRRHPYIDIGSITRETDKSFSKMTKELEKEREEHPDLSASDIVRTIITDLFENKVGAPYLLDKLTSVYADGEKRYQANTPPGYMDAKDKKDSGKFSDLVLWFQILDKAKEKSVPVIFVCDDAKEDWWWIFSGKVIGPRPELIEEFIASTNMKFYMYTSDRFMEYARDYLQERIGQKAIKEVQEIRQEDEDKRTRESAASQMQRQESSEIEYVRNNWRNMLEEAPSSYRRTPAVSILRSAGVVPVSIEGDILTLSSKWTYLKEKLDQLENREIAEKVLSGYLGHPCHIKVILQPPAETNP